MNFTIKLYKSNCHYRKKRCCTTENDSLCWEPHVDLGDSPSALHLIWTKIDSYECTAINEAVNSIFDMYKVPKIIKLQIILPVRGQDGEFTPDFWVVPRAG